MFLGICNILGNTQNRNTLLLYIAIKYASVSKTQDKHLILDENQMGTISVYYKRKLNKL